MKAILRIISNVVIWGALAAYLVFAARHCTEQQREEELNTVNIVVTDSGRLKTVSSETVRGWLEQSDVPLEGSPLRQVNTGRISELIGAHAFIATTKTWVEQNGTLNIEVSQRQPIIRVVTDDGYDFYISHDYWILPSQHGKGEYVPVVTGRFGLPFARGWFGNLEEVLREEEKKSDENYCFLVKLINFVKLTNDDPFWRDEIVQIAVTREDGAPTWKEPDIELVPRVGNHTIAIGTLDDAAAKLAKLRLFYDNVLAYEGWDEYKMINIKYNNQVICTK